MAIAMYKSPECPEECGQLALPQVTFADCVNSVQEEESEINKIYIVESDADGKPVAYPTDWTDATAWQTVLSQTEAGKIREITVIGDMPASTSETRTISNRRKKTGRRQFGINADVDDMSPENREFIRTLQCGATVHVWATTIGGGMYGGQQGIKCDVTTAEIVLERGENAYTKGVLGFQWEHKASPEWIPNPLA